MNKIMALIAFATLAAFLGILVWHVPHWDLIAVTAAVVLLAARDFLTSARDGR
ncbi:hypothetical protein [Mangrovicoccus sp. HB161399]|uniref:hypothetical protein n=1 Tax=Mangrovicoccus sp. HB161399 TaxID=2720392 RepID=UPI0015569B56|nr:hypothetical protein [Mangrovicoccus sp. HB161399]